MKRNKGKKESYFQPDAVSGRCYEWQLLVGNTWLCIENDHVIEAHYCQPGAKAMTINTGQGKVSIDFDKLQTVPAAVRVQRLSLLPHGQTEDIGWYFRDDQLWQEYGSQSSSLSTSSISSKDIEQHFTQNPQGSLRFTVGSTGYSLDFSTMTQTNLITWLSRNVRRRPKFSSPRSGSMGQTLGAAFSMTMHHTSTSPAAFSSSSLSQVQHQLPAGAVFSSKPQWQFEGDSGTWHKFRHRQSGTSTECSVTSDDIERKYQLNPRDSMTFKVKGQSYTLDFGAMIQTNHKTQNKRRIRRVLV